MVNWAETSVGPHTFWVSSAVGLGRGRFGYVVAGNWVGLRTVGRLKVDRVTSFRFAVLGTGWRPLDLARGGGFTGVLDWVEDWIGFGAEWCQ